MDDLIKIEIGCGRTKTEGYIGIDRFPFENVDIVADIDVEGLPLEDDYVDVVFACHSLEHMNCFQKVVHEIYRVCKNGAIVNILAPYYQTSLNMANIYHKSVFNEHTFRFFSHEHMCKSVDEATFYFPHAGEYGLSQSDNSSPDIEFQLLNMEFFYFDEYAMLSEEEKLRAMKALNNVCDQMLYSLVVNKSGVLFDENEIIEFKKKAKQFEPPVVDVLRNRTINPDRKKSIITDISDIALKHQGELEERIVQRIEAEKIIVDSLKQRLEIEKSIRKALEQTIADEKDLREQLESKFNALLDEKIQNINKKLDEYWHKTSGSINLVEHDIRFQHRMLNSTSSVLLEVLKSNERRRLSKNNMRLFDKNKNLLAHIRDNYLNYTDGIILNCEKFNKSSILKLSPIVPFDSYFEYDVNSYGGNLHYFVIANIGSKLFIEIVQNNQILHQEHLIIEQEGEQTINIGDIRGKLFVRFRTLDNSSIIRVLEVSNRKLVIFTRNNLAAYAD